MSHFHLHRPTKAFTLTEIMIVIAIIGIIIAIAVPALIRSREISRARACQESLSKIDGAADIYAIENKLTNGDTISVADDLVKDNGTGYLKQLPVCPSDGVYDETVT